MSEQDKLRSMIDNADNEIDALRRSISQIQIQIDDLEEQSDAMIYILDTVANDLSSYLNNVKLLDYTNASVVLGNGYNSIGYQNQLDDWMIIDNDDSSILYQYNGTGWDNDMIIVSYMNEWDFANDYLTRPLTTGASYGIRPYIDNLLTGQSILEENLDKIDASKTKFERFAT